MQDIGVRQGSHKLENMPMGATSVNQTMILMKMKKVTMEKVAAERAAMAKVITMTKKTRDVTTTFRRTQDRKPP
jgi:hypothetical protein